MFIGFDYGTANCSVAVMRDGKPHLLKMENDSTLLPSMLCAPTREAVSEWLYRHHDVPADDDETQALLRRAIRYNREEDIACYASKNGGRGRVTVYEPQQAAAHSERAAMSLDEQWRMIKENQLMMLAHGVASPRIPEARNLWLISLKLWSCEGEIIDEQTFRRSFSDPALSHALDRRVFHEFFQQAAKAVASKGISISLPLSVAGLSSATLVNDLLEQLENSPLPPRLLHLIIPAEAILDHAESVQKLRLAGCRIVLSQVGRDLQIFNSLKANMADYLLLDGELCANVQGNLMDEMLITIIQGHAQRLGMKTIAGPVVLPLVMDTLSGIGVDLIYGEVIADAQPLDLLVNSSYFAIN